MSYGFSVGWAVPTRLGFWWALPTVQGNAKNIVPCCCNMPNYRRIYREGSTVFLTWITYNRAPIFSKESNVNLFRQAVRQVKTEMPFTILAAAVLPDHVHFIWSLPETDDNYSKRVGRIKVLFTRAFQGKQSRLPANLSRQKHRESEVWQRRFWEHTIRDEQEYTAYLNYIHYNPVKHNLVLCPHLWPHSSFYKWVRMGHYAYDWACQCSGQKSKVNRLWDNLQNTGE